MPPKLVKVPLRSQGDSVPLSEAGPYSSEIKVHFSEVQVPFSESSVQWSEARSCSATRRCLKASEGIRALTSEY